MDEAEINSFFNNKFKPIPIFEHAFENSSVV